MVDVRTARAGLLAACLGLWACDCGGSNLAEVHDAAITIASPQDGAAFSNQVTFGARATSTTGIQFVRLLAGERELKNCLPLQTEDTSAVDCTVEFSVRDLQDQAQNNALTLTAKATDELGDNVEASVVILVAPLTVDFVKPALTQQDPPVAKVEGMSELSLAVESILPMGSVRVFLDDGPTPIAEWSGAGPYARNITWTAVMGAGQHVLKAEAKDQNGATARAERTVLLEFVCRSDADCTSGTRCCTTSGRCNPIVGAGADCDCDHPCPLDQGCFPGTCGTLPRKCRPGCDPGGTRPGDYAERCMPERQGNATVPAYCRKLDASETTSQNKGGACAPSDGCSITAQDCPDAPFQKNTPTPCSSDQDCAGQGRCGPSNVCVIQYSCLPAAPAANICLPAGGIPLGGTGCSPRTCGDITQACGKGLNCVQEIDKLSGAPKGPPTCRAQCPKPATDLLEPYQGTPECGAGFYCAKLAGAGLEIFPTGTCLPVVPRP